MIGVGHHFGFPTFVPQTATTTVAPVFGLNKIVQLYTEQGLSLFVNESVDHRIIDRYFGADDADAHQTWRSSLQHVEDRREAQTFGKDFIDDSNSVHTYETPGRAAFNKTTRKILDSDRYRSDDCIGNDSSDFVGFRLTLLGF